MTRRFRVLSPTLIVMLLPITPVRPASPKAKALIHKDLVVFAQRGDREVDYKCHGIIYRGKELEDALGEWHITATKDSQVVVIFQDDMRLSDIKDAPVMAMKAGFTNIRAFVYWKGKGNMAEVFFGPVMKIGNAELSKKGQFTP
jgi:hypothetical protein